MTLSDYYPIIIPVSVIVGGIATLRVFFTLWGPVDRRLNPKPLPSTTSSAIHINELKDKTVNIHLISKTVLHSVVLHGYCTTHTQSPYQIKQLLIARLPDGGSAFIRMEEIEYFELQPGNA